MLLRTLHGVTSEVRPSLYETNCSSLQIGQYLCPSPDIDPLTQQPKGCGRNNIANSIRLSDFYCLHLFLWIPCHRQFFH